MSTPLDIHKRESPLDMDALARYTKKIVECIWIGGSEPGFPKTLGQVIRERQEKEKQGSRYETIPQMV